MIKLLSTDQHIQIRLYMAKKPSDILQLFDVYHTGKSIKKHYSKLLRAKVVKNFGCGLRQRQTIFVYVCLVMCDPIKVKEKLVKKYFWEEYQGF